MARRVVIVGAGFGGLTCARALARVPVEVMLIDRENYHLFTPLLYQVASALLDPSEIARPVRSLVRARNVEFRLAEVRSVDLEGRRLVTDHGPVAYDHLVLAAGSVNDYLGIAGLAGRSHSLKSMGAALALRNHVLHLFEEARWLEDAGARRRRLTFVVVGGGPTGVEYAGALSELLHLMLTRDHRGADPADVRVLLVEASERLLGAFDPRLGEQARRSLAGKGIEVRLGTAVKNAGDGKVELATGEVVDAATVVWTAGVRASPLAKRLTERLGRQGTVAVTPELTLPGHPEVFVIGDMAAVQHGGGQLPMLAPVAQQEARHVARSIAATVAGRPGPGPFRYSDKGIMATIGRNAAVVELGRVRLGGFIGWLIWVFLHLALIVTFRSRVVTLINWAWDYFLYDRPVRLIASADQPASSAAARGQSSEPAP